LSDIIVTLNFLFLIWSRYSADSIQPGNPLIALYAHSLYCLFLLGSRCHLAVVLS